MTVPISSKLSVDYKGNTHLFRIKSQYDSPAHKYNFWITETSKSNKLFAKTYQTVYDLNTSKFEFKEFDGDWGLMNLVLQEL